MLFCISDASLNHEAERVSIQPKGDVQLVRVVPHTCTFLCLLHSLIITLYICTFHTFGRHAKTADENGSNPVRFLKSHVRREKGPTRGPGGPSVAGRGAHVSTAGKRSGAKTKKFEVPILPPEDLSVP